MGSMNDAAIHAMGKLSLTTDEALLRSPGLGAASFGGDVSVASGGRAVAESAGVLGASASTVGVTGAEGVRVGSTGALVELGGTGSGEVEYVGFVWRSSSSFTEFSNEVPS
eukprot:COSAG05_NODE_16947_length_332_cov_0.766949_1_plen_110_part_11